MQDNQLHGNLTVEEAMKVATSLKLSSDLSKVHKEEVVSIKVTRICYFEIKINKSSRIFLLDEVSTE